LTKIANPFAPFGFKPRSPLEKKKTTPGRGKCKLTATQIRNIKRAFKKCEVANCKLPPHKVHHIRFCKEEKGSDIYRNLIVLCGAHHDAAHGLNPDGIKIPKSIFYKIVENRDPDKAERVKEILASTKKIRQKRESKKSKNGFWG